MAVMRTVGNGHSLPQHARVREDGGKYVVELDVSDFTPHELTVEVLGRVVTIRGEQTETAEDEGRAFRLHERLTESFRLPDDADADRLTARYRHGVLELYAHRRELVPVEVQVEFGPTHVVNPDAAAC